MASEWKKTTIEIESVTLSGSAFASSSEGNVFVPARMIEVSDVREGDIIFATLRENYPDKQDIAPWLCARLHIDHPESVMPDETDEEAPQSPPPHVASNVVPLVRGTELIDAARGLVPLTFRSLNSFMRPFAQMPRGFCHPAMNGGGADCRTH